MNDLFSDYWADAAREVVDAGRLVVAFSRNGTAATPNGLHREQGCCMHCAIARLSNALIKLDRRQVNLGTSGEAP